MGRQSHRQKAHVPAALGAEIPSLPTLPSTCGTPQPPRLPEAWAEARKQGKTYFRATQKEEDAFLSTTSKGNIKSVISSSGQI